MLDNLPRNSNFTDREHALDTIADTLLLPSSPFTASKVEGPRVFALCGLGGIGKTEIAIELAHRYQNNFDAILWAQADSHEALENSVWQMLVRLGLQEQFGSRNPAENKEVLRNWLSDPWKPITIVGDDLRASPFQRFRASWLLVFNGADDPLILQEFCSLHHGAILVTSRNPLAKTVFPILPAGLDRQSLEKQEGNLLLKRWTIGKRYDIIQVENLFEILGGFPLAIFQMAMISVSRILSLEEIYKLYNWPTQHSNLHNVAFESTTSSYLYNLATVWQLEMLRPAARTLLEIITFLDLKEIREQLFDNIHHNHRVLDFSKDPASFHEVRNELMQSYLVDGNEEGINLTIHGIVQDVAISKLESNRFDSLFSFTVF